MLADGGDAVSGAQQAPGGLCYADDSITMPLQCGTQWDALSHISYDGRMYNDRDVRLVSSRGAAENAITAVADGIAGRGVLLDLPRFLRVDALVNGTPVLPRDLDACAEAQGVAIESGDILLVRTGAMKRHLTSGSWQGYIGATPGLSIRCARWLYEREVAAVATDTFCVEVVPSEVADCAMPLHMISLRNTGVHFGEMFQLEGLAEACADDGEYAFLFCAPPLPITGSVGSPINPLAIK
jgi:kynurenine formamidase